MINKFSSMPLYVQLRDIIVEKIENGEYVENLKIPSEQELCDFYSISRPTVRQAISDLTNSGFLYKEKGKGTFVSKSKSRTEIKNFSGFSDSILDSEIPGDRKILSINILTSEGERRKLDSIFSSSAGHPSTTGFCEIKHVTVIKSETLAEHVSYIPLDLFPDIQEDIIKKSPSYDIMKGKYPLIPVRAKSALEINFSDQSDAELLQIQSGQPLLWVETLLSSKNGQVVEYICSKYRADKCKLVYEKSK